MSAREELAGLRRWLAVSLWLAARWPVVALAWLMLQVGMHKQIANRVLSPWQWVTVLVTGTEWENFYALRCHMDAQPEIRHIAEMMRHEMAESWKRGPRRLEAGEWHLPLCDGNFWWNLTQEQKCMVSASRCARVSLLRHGEKQTVKEEMVKAQRLLDSAHMSPFEHQAQALPHAERCANYRGWRSFRATIPDENDFGKLLAARGAP